MGNAAKISSNNSNIQPPAGLVIGEKTRQALRHKNASDDVLSSHSAADMGQYTFRLIQKKMSQNGFRYGKRVACLISQARPESEDVSLLCFSSTA